MLGVLFLWASPVNARGFVLDKKYNSNEINLVLKNWAKQFNEASYQLLGQSYLGRDIGLLKISSGKPSNPPIYVNGGHHGDERIAVIGVMKLLEFLLDRRSDPPIRRLISSYDLYFQPIVNPDGYEVNTREDYNGIDPNRDYPLPGVSDKQHFYSLAAKIVHRLNFEKRFRGAIAIHAGLEAVLWPFGFTGKKTVDHDIFFSLAKIAGRAMGIGVYQQSFYDYPTYGEYIDFAYLQNGTLALTFEISAKGDPVGKQKEIAIARAIRGGLTYLLSIERLDRGKLPIEVDVRSHTDPHFLSIKSMFTTFKGKDQMESWNNSR
jgi:predicted deacylase